VEAAAGAVNWWWGKQERSRPRRGRVCFYG
jgi:hypothetical protein